jgi:SAM-dependent methyltransferase
VADIGCATGAWLRNAAATNCFRESHLFGIEVAAPLFSVCAGRRAAGEFLGARLDLLRGDALDGPFFPLGSIDTVHTSSVTHEIYSHACDIEVSRYLATYPEASLASAHVAVGERQLRRFILQRHQELRPGGLWINRDVVGPECGDVLVNMELSSRDGSLVGPVPAALMSASTLDRFQRFAQDHRRAEGFELRYRLENSAGRWQAQLSIRDAWEFAMKKDYVDNWEAEMHESFCFWSFSDWVRTVEELGFEVLPGSRSFTNPWIVERRLQNSIRLFSTHGADSDSLPFPSTNMVLIARRR